MRDTHVTLPELALIAGTRAALGAGIGLLLSDRLTAEQRRAIGWTLLLFGAITTIPLAIEVLGHRGGTMPSLSSGAPAGQSEQTRGGSKSDARQRQWSRAEERIGYQE